MIKRIFDFCAAMTGLLILLPVFIVITALIVIESGRPVLFCQTRVGRNGTLFKVFKFRTMVVDAEKTGLKVTVDRDPRITRTGEFLRKSKLDELPQLFNVLIGDMSIVGPRPEVPEYVAFYSNSEREKVLSVRPGITDKASIEFRDENSLLSGSSDPVVVYREKILPIKIRYYIEYVENRSFMGDMLLILKTLYSLGR